MCTEELWPLQGRALGLQIEETRPRHRQYLQDNARLRLEKNDQFDKLEGLSGTPEKIQKQVDISPVYTTCVNGRRRNSP